MCGCNREMERKMEHRGAMKGGTGNEEEKIQMEEKRVI